LRAPKAARWRDDGGCVGGDRPWTIASVWGRAISRRHIDWPRSSSTKSGYTAHVAERQDARGAGAAGEPQGTGQGAGISSRTCKGFLEHVALIMDNERGRRAEKVTIMTLHAAKGLEFPAVFLPGWEDGLFPLAALDGRERAEGPRGGARLAYVGITRAEEVCTISFAANRRVYGQWQSAALALHRRVAEEHVEVLTPPGLYGGARDRSSGRGPMNVGAGHGPGLGRNR
jgi:DNA helicase-2/ATP-dependent DNA helicase PcrA